MVCKVFSSLTEKIVNFKLLHAYFYPIDQIISDLHQFLQSDENIKTIHMQCFLRIWPKEWFFRNKSNNADELLDWSTPNDNDL